MTPKSAMSPPSMWTLVALTGIAASAMHMFVPSLPRMAEFFDTEYRVMQLSIALFLALNGVLQLFVGPLSDRFGRRPMLLIGFGVFSLATIGCLLSTTVEIFLFFRGLQAAIVVAMVLSRAIISDLFERAKAASMIGYVTMGMAVVPMIAPAIGGLLDEAFGWHSNFVLLLVFGVIGFALVFFDVGETNRSAGTSFLKQVADYPTLLTSPRFWGYTLSAAFSSGVFFSYLGGAPFVGTELFRLSPTSLGFYFGAPALGYIAGNFVSARLAQRVGINRLILTGSATLAIAMSILVLVFSSGNGTATIFFGFMTFMGLGNGMVLPNAIAGSIAVRPQLAGTASGLGGAMLIGGGAALSALSGALLTPQSGALPLLYIQVIVATLSLLCILFVIWREAQLEKSQS